MISQFLDNEILKVGVFQLNTIRLINLSDVDMSVSNILIHNYTEIKGFGSFIS